MKILSAAQLREADKFTIERENLQPGALMERAAQAFTNWFINNCGREKEVAIFCGPGNNGGDGLAVARLLNEYNYLVRTFLPETDSVFSEDFKLNLKRLPKSVPVIRYKNISTLEHLHLSKTRIVDALFGTGLNRPLTGLYSETIQFLNGLHTEIISIDVPSGLLADTATPQEAAVVKAAQTITFSSPKLALLLPQNQVYSQQMHSVLIGLNIGFIESLRTQYHYIDTVIVKSRWKPRPQYAHKGTFGHALLLLGSYGKMGAAILSTRACLRSGAGLISVSLPKAGYQIMQTAAPEAMVLADPDEKKLTELPEEPGKYAAIGIGPGIGLAVETKKMVGNLLEKVKVPLVLDADALNILAADKTLLAKLPPETILTPHPKEFERLTQPLQDDFERLKLLRDFCENYRCYVVLKGANTCIGTPSGNLYFNSTGNPGMATGGSGDALTGIITALRAQGYSAEDACILGVYTHGLAGDLAKNEKGETALIASDIIENLGKAFKTLEGNG
ncbi:NAD(P)H-hydrate dehydratase [Adhaeribacter terreus]|uniref:Bifunctional NAD(P)H-hydrate repair enzyme n=1 Tax=Adhaeribacter terreus TaxID=529703 RepID=A0ABW0EA03_9BACT